MEVVGTTIVQARIIVGVCRPPTRASLRTTSRGVEVASTNTLSKHGQLSVRTSHHCRRGWVSQRLHTVGWWPTPPPLSMRCMPPIIVGESGNNSTRCGKVRLLVGACTSICHGWVSRSTDKGSRWKLASGESLATIISFKASLQNLLLPFLYSRPISTPLLKALPSSYGVTSCCLADDDYVASSSTSRDLVL